jgi:hypothetical protein
MQTRINELESMLKLNENKIQNDKKNYEARIQE